MSETLCGKCGFPIHRYASVRHFGTYVAHEEYECMEKMRTALGEAQAALAAATAREEAPLPAGLATVEALLDYIQSAGVENPDPIRQRLHAALAAHTERVVRGAAPYFVREFRSHWVRTGTAIRDEDAPLVAEQVARALAAAKGGA